MVEEHSTAEVTSQVRECRTYEGNLPPAGAFDEFASRRLDRPGGHSPLTRAAASLVTCGSPSGSHWPRGNFLLERAAPLGIDAPAIRVIDLERGGRLLQRFIAITRIAVLNRALSDEISD